MRLGASRAMLAIPRSRFAMRAMPIRHDRLHVGEVEVISPGTVIRSEISWTACRRMSSSIRTLRRAAFLSHTVGRSLSLEW